VKIDARFLVRLYPRKWRERYETEFIALTERDGFGWLDTFDVVRVAARERLVVHGRMPAILLMTVGLLPGALLMTASLSSLATWLAFQMDSRFGPIAIPNAVVRVTWLAVSMSALVYSWKRAATTNTLLRFSGFVFAASILNKWLAQTWLHPLSVSDLNSWTDFGRSDGLRFGSLILSIWIKAAEPRVTSILSSYVADKMQTGNAPWPSKVS
jgi:hypothetical protein